MTPEDVLRGLGGPLSLRRRIAYVAVALAGLGGSSLIGLLWATEPDLPTRTRLAFAVLVLIGLAWAAFGGWAVLRRTPLLARDRVIAGWLGLGAWALFTAGALAIRPSPGLIAVVVVLGSAAVVNLAAARRARSALLRRRDQLG